MRRRHDPAIVVDHDECAAPAIGVPVEVSPGDHHRPRETGSPLAGIRKHGPPPAAETPCPPPAARARGGNPFRRGEDSAAGPPSAPGECLRLFWSTPQLRGG